MQKILINIINAFIESKLTSKKDALVKINSILSEYDCEEINALLNPDKKDFDLNKHFFYIDELRKFISEKFFESDVLVENRINKILGLFIPEQSIINSRWKNEDKFDKLFSLSLLSYYIKKDKNDLNKNWIHNSKYGSIKMSINNAKPEKTQKQIISEKNFVSENKEEPKCPICIENINFKGSLVKDSRENLRVIMLSTLKKDDWFFQYSPYAYVNKHFILNNIEHTPMVINNRTIVDLINFVDSNNNYFLGSNADLTIIGGSLLGHNHYQGGEDDLPIMNAKYIDSFVFMKTKIDVLNWPLNAIKISSFDKSEVAKISNYFINRWKSFSDHNLKQKNNSTTLIVKKIKNNFEAYLIFRNNSTSNERPFGKFHIQESKFHIKQENIGLMEAAGLAILPKRLANEIQEIIELNDDNKIDEIKNTDSLKKHVNWIEKIIRENIIINEENLLKEISNVFVSCLEDCKVISDNELLTFVKDSIKYDAMVLNVRNEIGLDIEILPIGFTIKQIKLNNENFLLEYENINNYYENNDIFLNAFVGPVAGRIENGIVQMKDKIIKLKTDNNNNYIHGMNQKWSDLMFDIEVSTFNDFIEISGQANQYNIELNCNYKIRIILTIWSNKNIINFSYEVEADKETICNPTHHFYWRLPQTKDIFNLNLNLRSKNYWKLNQNFNPMERKNWIYNDFLTVEDIAKKIGEEQTKLVGGGIDHPIELIGESRIILSSQDYRSKLMIDSTLTNVVIYTHNWKSVNKLLNTNGEIHQGLCIEYQEIPTSNKNQNFRKIIISKRKPYKHNTIYMFEAK